MVDLLLPLEEHDDIDEDIDINYSMGVLNIDLGRYGFWVINKQTPNRQIWWSSPVSGPRRYEYDRYKNQWLYTKSQYEGNRELISTLIEEIKLKTGVKLS